MYTPSHFTAVHPVRPVYVCGLRDYATVRNARHDSLWHLLLQPVRGGNHRRQLGDVADQALTGRRQLRCIPRNSRTSNFQI